MDAVISVGAGEMQFEFIKRLKELGLCVVAFGHGRNSKDALAYCDYFKDIDTADEESALRWLNHLKDANNLNFVGAGSYAGGVAIKTLQKISNYYSLPTQVPKDLIVGMDKYTQQVMYKKFGLANIETKKGADLYKDISLVDKRGKYILKPAITRGSIGIEFVSGEEVIERIETRKLNLDDIIQDIVTGVEYRMLMIVQEGVIKLIAPVRRSNYKDSLFLGRLEIDNNDYIKIREHAAKIVRSLQLCSTIIKYDILVNEKGVNLIEMDVGVGGGYYFKKYVSQVVGEDLMNIYIDLILGRKIKALSCRNSQYVMDYIYNESEMAVDYNLDEVIDKLKIYLGPITILVNRLHPEKKGKYYSNSDFIFTVIHGKSEVSAEELNQYINQNLFR